MKKIIVLVALTMFGVLEVNAMYHNQQVSVDEIELATPPVDRVRI
jgi:hypothetical protein